jgi:hypothetical protein
VSSKKENEKKKKDHLCRLGIHSYVGTKAPTQRLLRMKDMFE